MKSLLVGLALFVSLSPAAAYAGLGGNVASVEADRAQMKGAVVSRQASSYTVHEIEATSGTTVREFVSPAGTVFAVAWQGPFVPNMEQLLGTYFDQYSAGVRANKATYVGRRPLNLQLPGLTVQMNGYMHAIHFRAYIPEQLPAGAKQEELW
jgi:hypothetical protein